MNRCLILSITLLMVAGLCLSWRFKSSIAEASRDSKSGNVSYAPALFSDHSENKERGLPTKSKIRSLQQKSTREDTAALVRETVLPLVDLPEQSLAERVRELNRMIRNAGIDAARLTMVMDQEGSRPDRSLPDFSCGELRVRNLPLHEALNYIMDSTILRYQVVAGGVEFFLHDSVRDYRRRNDAMGAHEDRAMEIPPSGDPFGEAERE